jgi:predicted RecB family nuclease
VRVIEQAIRLSASDGSNFVACRHLTRLDLLNARGALDPPRTFDAGFQDLVRRGEAHEADVLSDFRSRGMSVMEVDRNTRGALAETLVALRSGVDVIYQATLMRAGAASEPSLIGIPDFLVRADLLPAPDDEPRPAERHYEVVDAKLARSAKGRAVLQTAFYSSLLAGLQEVEPRWMHLALGNGALAPFKVKDFAAYERQIRALLTEFVETDPGDNPPNDPYPEPVEHCAICRWSPTCAARRREDDDLSLVAGLTTRQRRALKAAGISSRRAFAMLDTPPRLERIGTESLERALLQARLQVASEDEGRLHYELLEPERDGDGHLIPNRGLLALPQPTVGDLFFDIEGARYYSEDGKEFGLQYLFGLVDTAAAEDTGRARYTAIWAFDRAGEKRAFLEVIDFITDRRQSNPGLHVYHYNHYEPTSIDHLSELHETREEAVGRLMGRFATREDEVDDLFRLGVFVDLYRVVRQGLRAGVESYSIKRLEPLCDYTRAIDLTDATEHLIAVEAALEGDGNIGELEESRSVVQGYNEEDCRAALVLRDWLEDRRAELASQIGADLPRPSVEEDRHATEDPEVTRIRSTLLASLGEDTAAWNAQDKAKAVLADLLDWHRRESKPAWWRYFRIRAMSDDELLGEPDALAGLKGGEIVEYVKRSVVRRFTFPPQEHGFAEGDSAFDPVTARQWTILSLDEDRGVVDLKIGNKDNAELLPTALVEGGPYDTRGLALQLRALGDRVCRDGLVGGDAATALLLRSRPNGDDLSEGPLRGEGETAAEAASRLALGLRASYLPIQGPPGTGKTYTAANQILDFVASKRRVGITGPSHAVIHNLIDSVLDIARKRGMTPRIGQRADDDNPYLHHGSQGLSYAQIESAIRGHELDVAAGTVWMWARGQFDESVDTLFVDEAAQMSLANVLAVAGAASNLVLLGDPQQLAQPSQAAHPPDSGVSALEHVLGDRSTMPPDSGLLLDRTWRMHPSICTYTSELFYDGKLSWVDGLERQAVGEGDTFQGAGLRVLGVVHEGNTNDSPEEAEVVATLVQQLLAQEWFDDQGRRRAMTAADVLVVSPYNAQVREIDAVLASAGLTDIRVGTVDKFQGRQAPAVIYSMATSSADQAPRGMEFLYDLHRLNVASSRARGLAILVSSPELVRVFCRTPRQIVLANALCRFREMADG